MFERSGKRGMIPSYETLWPNDGDDILDISLQALFEDVYYFFVNINQGIDFSPPIASWLFLFAIVNVAFPVVLTSAVSVVRRNTGSIVLVVCTWVVFDTVWPKLIHWMDVIVDHHFSMQPSAWSWFSVLAMLLACLSLAGSLLYTQSPRSSHKPSHGMSLRPAVSHRSTVRTCADRICSCGDQETAQPTSRPVAERHLASTGTRHQLALSLPLRLQHPVTWDAPNLPVKRMRLDNRPHEADHGYRPYEADYDRVGNGPYETHPGHSPHESDYGPANRWSSR